ncbi:hypothetical protein K1T71_010474 [Dendrolimus kikuchii]|uniref:Uncharacterized protein n=1 Tax=Dendrolimus kikuchii TaxID=765133 RepID=A0ACC1CRZ6_9NEOP|nr:hypothetical protein K1T71_010474 [Dendrolimus kikuchii]
MATAADIYNQALSRKIKIEKMSKGDSEIQKFYENSGIFVTGFSGFLAKQLVEKLLRSCEVKRIYVLLRAKKSISPHKRLEDILKEVVFDDLRSKQPNFGDKIRAVSGDIDEVGLGITEDDFKLITGDVEIIIHSAAMVKFNAPVAQTTITNIRGTREVLKLGQACKKLRSFVHVSTAYSHATESRCNENVMEIFYQCPVPPDVMIKMAEEIDATRFRAIEDKLMQDWPNSYTFTKAITEELIKQTTVFPVCIVRPSTVLCSYSEPYPGWVDRTTLNSATGMAHDITTGVMHALKARNDVSIDFVPIDFVNNVIIACAWETARRSNEGKTDIRIYNACSGVYKRAWGELSHTLKVESLPYTSPRSLWYPFCFDVQKEWLYYLIIMMYHFIPAYLIDVYSNLTKKNSRLVKQYKQIFKLTQVLQFFTSNQWEFKISNTEKLYNKMSKCDQSIFYFDMSGINWREFILLWVIGIRNFIIEDGIGTSQKYLEKLKTRKYLTYFITCIYFFVFILLCYFVYFMSHFFVKCFVNLIYSTSRI